METFWGEVIAGDINAWDISGIRQGDNKKKNLGVKRGLWVLVTGQTQKDITGFMDQFTK